MQIHTEVFIFQRPVFSATVYCDRQHSNYMKPNTLLAGILYTCLLMATVLPANAQLRTQKGQKKGIHLALNITNQKKQPSRTYFNLGLLSNYPCLNGMGINALSSVTYHHSKGLQVTGLTNITGLDVAGFQLAGIANVTGRNTSGIVLGGLVNVNGGTINGFALSGIGNMSARNTRGILFSGLLNMSNGNSSGVQLAGIANITGQDQNGLMLGGLMNACKDTIRGMQLTSLLNVVGSANQGVQLAMLGNVAVTNQGVQLGLGNYSAENKGVQLGIANISSHGHKSLQLGFFNLSSDSLAHQIGCINISPRTHIQLIVSSGNLNKANVAVRFKNRFTYTELGGGAWYFDLDHDLSASAFYRAGIYLPLCRLLEISADAGFYHIETLDNKHKGYPARAYALQPRLNLEFRITKKLGIFASGGYAWTRPYSKGHTLDHKGTFEAGIVLF